MDLEQHMKLARSIVEAASNARQKVGRKLRWPVGRIVVTPQDETAVLAVKNLKEVLMDQTNSKDIVLTEIGGSWDELGFSAIPNPGAIGPAFKGDAGKVIAALKQVDAIALKKELACSEGYELQLADGRVVTISPDMVNFQETLPELVASASSSAGIVYVDAKLTRELEAEGYSREVIRRVQDMRKEMDLAVEENIKVIICIDDERVVDLVLDLEQLIASEVRADVQIIGFDVEVHGELVKDWDVEGISMHIGISRS
jgi:isoleucyl-tRNA synthetase